MTQEKPEHLQMLVDKLKEEIKNLDIKKEGLISSIHELNVHKEAERKIEETKFQREKNQFRKEISDLKSNLIGEREQIEHKEMLLDEREAGIAKREAEVKDAKFWLDKLSQERKELYELRQRSKAIMEEAQGKMAEVTAFQETYQIKNDRLAAREKVVNHNEKWWNDRIGELEQRIKELNSRESDVVAREKFLEKPQEAKLNV